MSQGNYSVAILVYGQTGRDALTEEKYKDLAESFKAQGADIHSVCYHDSVADELSHELQSYNAILVWVNPIEQGKDRKRLDALLTELATKGCFVSTHPEVILKMGTKDVLYKTRNIEWAGDVKMYSGFDDFKERFERSLQSSGIRVLKQYRGNGGDGVYKITSLVGNKVSILHAKTGSKEQVVSMNNLFNEFEELFLRDGLLIDQEWNRNLSNGMVRCYVSGSAVAGFGYQEINALAGELPGKRYYYTEKCGLFSDLKWIMEDHWIAQLKSTLQIEDKMMPVIWDADFFINSIDSPPAQKYQLCEINVSCVSPFPPSAIPYIIREVENRKGK